MKLSKLSIVVAAAVFAGNSATAASGSGALDVSRVTEENTVGAATSCLIMSQKMESQKNTPQMLSSYVTVENLSSGKKIEPSLLVQNRAICLGGLDFGSKYRVTLKKGLISAENGMLSKDRTVDFTTVDHQGVVQFLNGNVISAASKDKKVALQTVNMNKFRISLFKISSSDLASYSANPLTEAQYRWSATSKITEHGKFLGSKEVSINGVKNQKNITMINLSDLTDDLTSGLYMLVLTEPDFEECDATLDYRQAF